MSAGCRRYRAQNNGSRVHSRIAVGRFVSDGARQADGLAVGGDGPCLGMVSGLPNTSRAVALIRVLAADRALGTDRVTLAIVRLLAAQSQPDDFGAPTTPPLSGQIQPCRSVHPG
jgi:hypothetical protein